MTWTQQNEQDYIARSTALMDQLTSLIRQVGQDQNAASAVLAGLQSFVTADANSNVTFYTQPNFVCPSLNKMLAAYTTAINTASLISQSVRDDITKSTADTVASARLTIQTLLSNSQTTLSNQASSSVAAVAAEAANDTSALNALAQNLTAALQTLGTNLSAQLNAYATSAGNSAALAAAWAESTTEPVPGSKSAKYWAQQAAAVSNITAVQAVIAKDEFEAHIGLDLFEYRGN